jgi:hypothetical protein
MQQRVQPKGAPASKKGTPPASASAPAPAETPATPSTTASSGDKPIRSVGPTFLPNNSTPR